MFGKESSSVHQKLQQFILADGFPILFDSERSHGPYLVDARNGRSYLDLFSFFVTQPIGFNHPKLNTKAFRKTLGALAIHRPTLSDVYTEEYAQAVETFVKIAGRSFFSHYFFVEGGSLGVENALKIAFDWKVRKNLSQGKGEKGNQIIHFREAFHGRSGYALSMTNTFDPNKYKFFPKFSWPRITNPKLRFPTTVTVENEVAKIEQQAISEIKKAFFDNPNDIAAILIEPIQCEGGDNHFRPSFFQELRNLADENDALFIFDEVQTGIGLTGKMWCFEHFPVQPDVIAFGKKVQVGGCASNQRIDEISDHVFRVGSRMNSTWGGNLIDFLRMKRFLEIIEEDHLVENAAQVGAYFQKQLEEWSKNCSRISNVRGRGLLIAFDLPDTKTRNLFKQKLFENGIILLPCGPVSLRIRPHLDFTKENVEEAMKILTQVEKTL